MTYIVFQLTSRQFAHRAAMASHAIVHDDGQIVSAQTHIRLDAIDAALDRRSKDAIEFSGASAW
jgi:hypothetical protein